MTADAANNPFSLDGKAIVIVGAGNGMGAESAAVVTALGARVLCVDIDAERASAIATEVGGVPIAADATTEDGVSLILATAQSELGGIDGLIDIVGFGLFKPIASSSDEELRDQFRLNFDHAFRLIRALPEVISPDGSVVFITSSLGITGAPHQPLYGAAKAGMMSLIRSAALEQSPVRFNAVAPGVIGTPRINSYLEGAGALGLFEANNPLGRIGRPREIATTAAFLLGPGAAFINGQTITVDGGVSVKSGYPDMPS